MADSEIKTVKRLYIRDKDKARHSVIHTVYCGSTAVEPGKPQGLVVLEFAFGVARNVPTQIAQRFIDLGHATTERPKTAAEEAEEAEEVEDRTDARR